MSGLPRGKGSVPVKSRGTAGMADVSGKPETVRVALAEGYVHLSAHAWNMVRDGKIPKGDVEAVSRVAGIMAAKATPGILPLCHPVPLFSVRVDVSLPRRGIIRVEAEVGTVARTGVEMEALVAVAAAALCVYDMVKPVDRSASVTGIRLLRKTGGKSGDYSTPLRKRPRRSRSASRDASDDSPAERGRGPKRSR